jgi:hypothetical protein
MHPGAEQQPPLGPGVSCSSRARQVCGEAHLRRRQSPTQRDLSIRCWNVSLSKPYQHPPFEWCILKKLSPQLLLSPADQLPALFPERFHHRIPVESRPFPMDPCRPGPAQLLRNARAHCLGPDPGTDEAGAGAQVPVEKSACGKKPAPDAKTRSVPLLLLAYQRECGFAMVPDRWRPQHAMLRTGKISDIAKAARPSVIRAQDAHPKVAGKPHQTTRQHH